MRIKALAIATTVLAAAGGSAALACEGPGPCAYAPTSDAYVFLRPHGPAAPQMRGPATGAYVFAPGPTPAYAAEESYDRYGGESRDAGARYGEVRPAYGYAAPYTPAFGRGVFAEQPYAGPGYGYRVEHHACGTCAPRLPRFVSPCAEACDHRPASVVFYREERSEEGRPVQVSSDFFYGGITGGAGYGIEGGGYGGGGGFFADSGYGFSATQAFSSSMSSAFAGASASAHAYASAKASAMVMGYHPKMGHGCGCHPSMGGWGKGGKH